MLSGKLVKLVQNNWEGIADSVVRIIRHHPEMPNMAQIPDAQIKEWCRDILQHLGDWLATDRSAEIRQRYEFFGRQRFEENLPLHEAVLRVQILKDAMISYIHSQGFPMTSLELYAEEELELRASRFFDAFVYNLVRGYEAAIRQSIRIAS